MIFFPNCKINIGLDITARRPDGYHDIETLMVPVRGLTDILEIVPSREGGVRFSSSGIEAGPAEGNLCVRAYGLMAELYPAVGGAAMHLYKMIPTGAGLGGGSADAAFTIKGLDQIFGLGLAAEEMEALGAKLGSDVPFFIRNEPQLASGRGEILAPHPMGRLRGMRLVVAMPRIAVSTAEAYAGVVPEVPHTPLRERLALPVAEWRGEVSNGFERSVCARYPAIGEIREAIYRAGAIYASMSGSGSAVYGLFADDGRAVETGLRDTLIHQEVIA